MENCSGVWGRSKRDMTSDRQSKVKEVIRFGEGLIPETCFKGDVLSRTGRGVEWGRVTDQ